MAKYIDADLLRKEIERRKNNAPLHYHPHACTSVISELEELLASLDSLQQEQQEVDLKKEIKEWTDLMVGASFPEQDGDFISEEDYRSVIRQTALHFYELGKQAMKQQMLKEAVKGEAEELYNDGESQCVVSVGTYFGPGDKVYVLKAEEK